MNNHSIHRWSRTLLVSAASAFAIAAAVPAHAQSESARAIIIDLPAAPLDVALLSLGNEFGITILATENLLAGKTAPAVSGELSAEEALNRLLKGSGLVAQPDRNGGFIISEAVPPTAETGNATPASNDAPVSIDDESPLIERTIIVSGEKIDRSLQDTISSVSVLTADALENSVILDLEQAVQRVPNVTITPDGFGLSIRGIAQQGIGNGTFDPVAVTSAIYIDGAVQTQQAVANGALSTWDVQQIEIFRGPQTATQGRAGLAGAFVVNTKDPEFEWGGQAQLIATDQNRQQVSAVFGGPILEDLLAFRIVAETVDDDGVTVFDFGGVRDDKVARNNRDFVRGKLLFTPTDQLEALLSLTYVEGNRGSSIVSGPDFFERDTSQISNLRDSEVFTGSLSLNYNLNEAISLQSVTAFSEVDVIETVNPNTAGGNGLAAPSTSEDHTLSQEFRLIYDANGPLRAILGLYYADIEETVDRTIAGPFGPFLVFRNDGFAKDFENTALFGQIEYDLSQAWSLNVGGRIESEERTFSNFAITDVEPDFPGLPDSTVTFEGTGDDSTFLPKLGVTYNVSEAVSLSATFQQAYRPGGTNLDPRDQSLVQFDPEITDNYDLALRSTWYDERLVLNANAFFFEYSDMQIRFSPDPTLPLIRFVDNVGEAELYGLEVESLFNPDSNWSFYASAAFQESEFKTFEIGGVDAAGDEFAFSPSFSAAIGGTWTNSAGWGASVDISHDGSYFSNLPNGEAFEVGSSTVVGGRAGYDHGHWGVFLFAENVFDEDYFTSVNRADLDPTLQIANVGQPRTIGITLEAKF